MIYSFLADVIVAIHVAYVSFVLLGQVAILVGGVLGWAWVRRPWFRGLHLLAILIVAGEALAGVPCPLTVWENDLRRLAGQSVQDGTFIGRCLHDLIFFDGPTWVFTTIYVGFAALVLLSLVLVPPRWRPASRP
jgi:hypothetical protein